MSIVNAPPGLSPFTCLHLLGFSQSDYMFKNVLVDPHGICVSFEARRPRHATWSQSQPSVSFFDSSGKGTHETNDHPTIQQIDI